MGVVVLKTSTRYQLSGSFRYGEAAASHARLPLATLALGEKEDPVALPSFEHDGLGLRNPVWQLVRHQVPKAQRQIAALPDARDAQHGHALGAVSHELEGGFPGPARRVARQQFGPALAVGFYWQSLREVEDLHACNSGADKRDHPPLSPQAAFTQVRWPSIG